MNGEKDTDHKEQYDLNQARFKVEPFEFFRIIKSTIQKKLQPFFNFLFFI